jgi:hypothetical protein
MAVYEITKPLTYLMKLVNLDTARKWLLKENKGKKNKVLYNLT